MADGLSISIRNMRPPDAPAVHAMIRRIAEATGHGAKLQSTPEDLCNHAFGAVRRIEGIVAERSGELLGACLFYFTYSTWLGSPGVYISDIYVAPAARGASLGRRLLAAAAIRGKEFSATHLRLSVDAANESAQAFYRQIGMEYRHDEQIWHLDREGLNLLTEDAE